MSWNSLVNSGITSLKWMVRARDLFNLLLPGFSGNSYSGISWSRDNWGLAHDPGFYPCILHFDIKETTFNFGYFTTISGHFFANYINIFHKTEVQTFILRSLVSLNLNWIKSYYIILVKKKFHAWKCVISGLFRRSDFWHLLRKPALIFSKLLFFQNSFGLSLKT